MLHGAALDILKRCRAKGTFILGEAVNAHIDMAISILAEEHDRLGLPFKRYHRVWEHMRQEYELCDRILVPSEWVAPLLHKRDSLRKKLSLFHILLGWPGRTHYKGKSEKPLR